MTTSLHPLLPMSRQRGFTLVEAIIVMVITGILAGIMVLFIRKPVQNYIDAAARADMGDVADLALRRMTRELRTALPNSVRISVIGSVSLLEFIPTKAGGTYLSDEDNPAAGTHPLSFTNPAVNQFDMLDQMQAAPYDIKANDYIVVYNLGSGYQGADAYAGSNRATVSAVVANGQNGSTITLSSNVFGSLGATGASPTHRFNATGQPVTFRCEGKANGTGTLTRYWNYGFPANQVDPGVGGATPQTPSSALMASNVLACQFSYTTLANVRNSLIGLGISLARPSIGAAANNLETVTLAQQIHVDNTP